MSQQRRYLKADDIKGVVGAVTLALALLAADAAAKPAVTKDRQITPITKGPYGKQLVECKRNWAAVSSSPDSLATCMSKLLAALGPRLSSPEGIPELDIPSLNPLVVPNYEMGGGTLTGVINNFTLFGVAEALANENPKFRYNPSTKVMTMEAAKDAITLTGDYIIGVNLAGIPDPEPPKPETGGAATGDIFGITVKVEMNMRDRRSGGVGVEKAQTSVTTTTNSVKLTNARPEGEALAQIVNGLVAGESGNLLIQEILPPLRTLISRYIGNIYALGWRKLETL